MKLAHTLLVMGLLLCVAGTTAQESFQVMISKTTVTLICPFTTPYSIKQNKVAKAKNTDYTISEYKSSQHDGKYICEGGEEPSITLYLKAKVCETCVELDPLTVAGIIIADLLITLGVLVLAYYFSKNRKGRGGGGGGRAGGHPRGQKMVRPPPVPNPDYEPIRKGQREVYAGLDSRGF